MQPYICISISVLLILASFRTGISVSQPTFGGWKLLSLQDCLGNICHESLTSEGFVYKRLTLVQGYTEKLMEERSVESNKIDKLHQEQEIQSTGDSGGGKRSWEGQVSYMPAYFLASLEVEL